MMPRLGKKYNVDIEIISKPRKEYITDEYSATDLPRAPAIMVGDEVAVEGKDISENKLEDIICKHMGLEKRGLFSRLFKKNQ